MALAGDPVHPIHQAAKDGNLEVLRRSGKKDLNKPDSDDGWTAVHWCSWRGDAEALSIVLSRGGDPNKPDRRGCTPLHIAATYGNLQAAEVLVEDKANIWALDNRGYSPAKIAAMNKRAQCCRFLDNLSIQIEAMNKDYVTQQQIKAVRDLERRVKEIEKQGTRSQAVKSYSKKAASSRKRASSDPPQIPNRQLSAEEAAQQNFVLQERNEGGMPKDGVGSQHLAGESFPSFGGSGHLRPLPRQHCGAIVNNLSDLARRRITADDLRDSGSDPTLNSTQKHLRHSHSSSLSSGQALGRIIPLQSFETENDSEMATFLQSLDLLGAAQVLLKEGMDMEALSLCSDDDLRGIGLQLGPRLKIMRALEERKHVIRTPPLMTDSEL